MQPASKLPPKSAEQATLEECLLILLREIQNHTVNADEASVQQFRAEMALIERRFRATSNPRQLVDSAVDALGKYVSVTNESIARQRSVLQSVAGDLESAKKAFPVIEERTERWNHLEEQIKSISDDDDLEVTKARLCADLAKARTEALAERQKVSAVVSEVLNKVDAAPACDLKEASEPAVYTPDPLTGLPSRALAEAELRRIYGQAQPCCLALFVVKRLALINARFGYSRGDEVLLRVITHITQLLPEFNRLFRWAPCSFLTMAPSNMTYRELRAKVQIVELTRLAPTLEWEGRSAMVPVVLQCRVIPTKDFGTIEDLFLRLDTLAADV